MELKIRKNWGRARERGNVLFLILIAVALFAALSYAVTQSSRSGGGDAGSETNLISSAQVTQYPASIRTSIIRMIVSNGASMSALEFNPPADFADCTSPAVCVFHPSGGGATYSDPPADVVTVVGQHWYINAENEINLVGTSTATDATATGTADLIAFLPNVQKSICEKINKELGITGVPLETGIDISTNMGTGNTGTWVSGIGAGGGTIGDDVAALNGQAFGCFQQPATVYNYYHVLIEQ